MVDGIDPQTLVCDGSLTIGRAEELRDRLRTALDAGGDVEIDCSGADTVDLSFIQLLLAARLTAERQGIVLRFKGEKARLAAALRASGLMCDGDGFWSGGL